MKRLFTIFIAILVLLTACEKAPAEHIDITPPASSAVQSAAPTAAPTAEPSPADAVVTFVNVGKADAILIQTAGRVYVVDSGEKSSLPALIGTLRLMGVSAIDGLFITHTHSDHMGGAEGLSTVFPIAAYYTASITTLTDKGKDKLAALAADMGVAQTVLSAGDRVTVAEGIYFDVLAPVEFNSEDDNDNSLVMMLCVNDRRVLLTGDMQFAEESTIMFGDVSLAADVLKVGNHGNPDATSDGFARAVSPSIAVITTDTSVDADSANPRVLAALSMATVLITEDTDAGVVVRVGEELVSDEAVRPDSGLALTVTAVDIAAQTVTVHNGGGDTDISGVMLFSTKGNQLFMFPSGATIPAGGSVTVAAEGGRGDYTWNGEDKPWKNGGEDFALLYDAFGALIYDGRLYD